MKLYAIKAGAWCKIGIAKNLKRRLRSIQNANPLELKVIFEQEVPDAGALVIEGRAHSLLAERSQARRGEWFKTDWEHAIIAAREACEAYGTERGTEAESLMSYGRAVAGRN